MKLLLARTAEQGSRQLIWACIGGKDNIDQLHGAYISSMHIQEPSDFVVSEDGRRAQSILWVNSHLSESYYRITDKHVF
jgi:retinol dehydrogenase-12